MGEAIKATDTDTSEKPRASKVPVVSRENAGKQLDEFFDYVGIDEFSTKDRLDYSEDLRGDLIPDVMRGNLEFKVRDTGVIVTQMLRSPLAGDGEEQLDYNLNKIGRAKRLLPIGTDKKPVSQYKRWHSLITSVTGASDAKVQNMHPIDLSLAESVAAIFLSI